MLGATTRLGTGLNSVEPGVQIFIKGYEGNVKTTGAVIFRKLNYVGYSCAHPIGIFIPFLNVFVRSAGFLLLSKRENIGGEKKIGKKKKKKKMGPNTDTSNPRLLVVTI